MINWILRTYKTTQGQCGIKEEGTGTDVGQSGDVVAKCMCAGVGWLQDSQQALKSERQSGEGFCDLLGFI